MIDAPTELAHRTATVTLDSTGRLLALSVPPDLVESTEAAPGEVDWSPIFDRAHLDQVTAIPVATNVTPAVFCDTVAAWRIDAAAEDQVPLTVVMGAVTGRPNFFEYVGLHDDMNPNHVDYAVAIGSQQVAWIVFDALMFLLACLNLAAGRADLRNALRFALLIGGLYAAMELVVATLGSAAPGARVMSLTNGRGLGHVLQHLTFSFAYYLAIEPFVRRVWPRMLIGAIRALSGRLRDPAVGREALIGLTAGCVFVALLTILTTVEWTIQTTDAGHLAHSMSIRTILSPGNYLSERAHVIAWSALSGLYYVGIVVIIRLLVRHAPTSAVLSIAAIGWLEFGMFSNLAGDSTLGVWAQAIGTGVCLVWLYTKVGVLAAMVFFYVMLSIGLFTTEFDAWSTPYIVALLASVFALATYGFWVSLAGQPIFKGMLAEPQVARQ